MPLLAVLVSVLRSDDRGQSNGEFGLLLLGIGLVALIALVLFGGQTSRVLSAVSPAI